MRETHKGPYGPLSFCPLSTHPPSPFARHQLAVSHWSATVSGFVEWIPARATLEPVALSKWTDRIGWDSNPR